jgi:RHS repeat-associated protein
MKDNISGEEVNYTYDSLNRLISAVTTGPEWGLNFTYDGFGNKTAQTLVKGTAPVHSTAVDPATNRVIGLSYDANGNHLLGPNQGCTGNDCYDVANRMTLSANIGLGIGYAPDNKRVWERRNPGDETYQERVMFYGVDGMRLGIYKVKFATNPTHIRCHKITESIYFGSKLIWQNGERIVTDRLGSVVQRGSTRLTYYPYGEEKGTGTPGDTEKFGTYYRDSLTGADYADQRYYTSSLGRFTSPDPYSASGGTADPSSWNCYSYTRNDPVNGFDPSGMVDCDPESPVSCYCQIYSDDPTCYPFYDDPNADRFQRGQQQTTRQSSPPDSLRTQRNEWFIEGIGKFGKQSKFNPSGKPCLDALAAIGVKVDQINETGKIANWNSIYTMNPIARNRLAQGAGGLNNI